MTTAANRRPPQPDRSWAYFLDFDGTLVAIAGSPDAVQLGTGLTPILAALYRSTGGAVALVTGRAIADIDGIFAGLRLPVAGQHGIERRNAAGRIFRPKLSARGFREAREALSAAVVRNPGLILEDKGLSLALHYRRVPRLGGYVHRLANSLVAGMDSTWHVMTGKYVVEIRPAGADKGTAINEFMQEPPFKGRTPIFLGDDTTDEYGFRMVRMFGGVAVKVGPGTTTAGWRLHDIAAVRSWLEHGHPALAPTR